MISIIAPFYNEQEVLKAFFESIEIVLDQLEDDYEIVCVNDGSSDNTLAMLVQAQDRNPKIRIVDFSRNFGKEAALTAGLDFAEGDAVIPIDVDLQDPPELILTMVSKWKQGYDVVTAKRVDRSTDTYSKRTSAGLFYKIHNKIAHHPLPENVGDYRLMDRKVVDALKKLPERQRFMKGLFAWVGYKTTEVEYVRAERAAGDSKFNGWKLWNFALEGITSFSTAPLRIWTYIGFLISFVAFWYSIFIITRTVIYGVDVPGYASLLVTMLFIGGIQLIGLGVVGEYIGRIYLETKARPLYLVQREYRKSMSVNNPDNTTAIQHG